MEKETTYESSTEPQSLSRKNIITYTVVAAVLLAAGIATGYAVGLGLRSSQQTAVNNNSASNTASTTQAATTSQNVKALNSYGDLTVGDKWECNKDGLNETQQDICDQMDTNLGGIKAELSVVRMAEITSEDTEPNRFVLGNITYLADGDLEINANEKFIYNMDVTGSAYVVHVSYINDTTDMIPLCQYVDNLGWNDVFPKCAVDENDQVGRDTK